MTRMEKIFEDVEAAEKEQPDSREAILQYIASGCVIPVISSSFRVEQIFHELANEEGPNVAERLVATWARFIKYPMEDSTNLARVAQYYFVNKNEDPRARNEYFRFINKFLWHMANNEIKDPALAAGLQSQIEGMTFSELVRKLDYPKFPDGTEDPLRLLARFPLPYYITTSPSDFIERALKMEGRSPRTQVCFWTGEMTNIHSEHRPIADGANADISRPVVYHLYGLEEYPKTLVLSEDDYINFLISIGGDTDNTHPKVPLYLRGAVGESQLILIGFRLSDWDFRVLFRLMMDYRTGLSPRGMLIQLQEREREASNENALKYLQSYFGRRAFDIAWSEADSFVQDLWNDWSARTR
jgi:hypothetical protein